MSISERERQALEAIEDGLARSAPKLTSMLAIFTRLTADETMPVRRPVRRAAGIVAGYPGPPRARGYPPPGRDWRPRLGRTARRWLWLTVALALLVLTVVLGHGTGRSPCMASRSTTCGQSPFPSHPGAARPGGPALSG